MLDARSWMLDEKNVKSRFLFTRYKVKLIAREHLQELPSWEGIKGWVDVEQPSLPVCHLASPSFAHPWASFTAGHLL